MEQQLLVKTRANLCSYFERTMVSIPQFLEIVFGEQNNEFPNKTALR